jgi:hypothetical protein
MRLPQFVSALFPWLPPFFGDPTPSLSPDIHVEVLSTPITCLSTSTIFWGLIDCFNKFTVPSNTYTTHDLYVAAQPVGDEIAAWDDVVASLLAVDGNCGSSLLSDALDGIYTVTLFTKTSGASYCVLSESTATSGRYTRGWGLMAVPATRDAVSRFIHISAPHPIYDKGTPQRAAAVFKGTGAKSLIISERHRHARSEDLCEGPDYSITDAAHDTVSQYC